MERSEVLLQKYLEYFVCLNRMLAQELGFPSHGKYIEGYGEIAQWSRELAREGVTDQSDGG